MCIIHGKIKPILKMPFEIITTLGIDPKKCPKIPSLKTHINPLLQSFKERRSSIQYTTVSSNGLPGFARLLPPSPQMFFLPQVLGLRCNRARHLQAFEKVFWNPFSLEVNGNGSGKQLSACLSSSINYRLSPL